MVRSEGLCQRKIAMTPCGIEPTTSMLVAQFVNLLRHRVPPLSPCKVQRLRNQLLHMLVGVNLTMEVSSIECKEKIDFLPLWNPTN